MKILLTCIHYPVASGRYIARACRRLGHDVRTLGPTTDNRIWGMAVDPGHAWAPDLPQVYTEPGQFPAVGAALRAADGWRPDLIITADSAYTVLGDLPGVPHVLWGVDNHVRDYRDLGRTWDAMFLAHSWGARMEEPNAHWLPAAYDPEAHRYMIAPSSRPFDVGLQAVAYPHRVAMVHRLIEAGVKVFAGTGLLWDDYEAFYNETKIALVCSAMGDLSQRFLEAMAMGCCVLADRATDALRLGFVPGEHFIEYATDEQAEDYARGLIRNGSWQAVAEAGRQAAEGHTWDHRARTLLRTLGLGTRLEE